MSIIGTGEYLGGGAEKDEFLMLHEAGEARELNEDVAEESGRACPPLPSYGEVTAGERLWERRS
jgi:hypothetical protein